jgi:CRP/FNR family transcriptional regulator, cyclic AMP receptor protein
VKSTQRFFWINPFKKENRDKQVLEAWRSTPLMLGVSSSICEKLVEHTHMREYQPGEYIFHEGDRAVAAAIILEGSVLIRSNDQVVARLETGEFFGEAALLEDSPRSASAVADGVTKLSLLVRYQFEEFIDPRPQAGLTIMRNLANLILARLHRSNVARNGNNK